MIATRDSSLGIGGPAMIEGGGLGACAPGEVGPVSIQEPNGVIDSGPGSVCGRSVAVQRDAGARLDGTRVQHSGAGQAFAALGS
jgi:hypothetical protein